MMDGSPRPGRKPPISRMSNGLVTVAHMHRNTTTIPAVITDTKTAKRMTGTTGGGYHQYKFVEINHDTNGQFATSENILLS